MNQENDFKGNFRKREHIWKLIRHNKMFDDKVEKTHKNYKKKAKI